MESIVKEGRCTTPVVWQYDAEREARLVEALTVREIEILRLSAHGLGDKEIGDVLGISWRTSRSHFATVMKKMGVHKRAHAVRMGLALGLVDIADFSPTVTLTLEQILNLITYYSQLARQYAKQVQP